MCSLKMFRSAFTNTPHQFLYIIFTMFCFRYDCHGCSETFLIDYFFLSIVLHKVTLQSHFQYPSFTPFVCALCSCHLFMSSVHALCLCSLFMPFVYVLCSCHLFMSSVHALCLCSLFMPFVYVLCSCPLIMSF